MSRFHAEVHPVADRIGAEVLGVDLADALPDETIARIRAALLAWKVLFFRDQHRLDPNAQLASARRFGPVTTAHPTVPGPNDHPQVLGVDGRRARALTGDSAASTPVAA